VYALSWDNRLKRPAREIRFLYKLLLERIDDLVLRLRKDQVEFRWSGSPEGLPQNIVRKLRHLTTHQPASPEGRVFNLMFNYSGRREIIQAATALAESGSPPEALTKDRFSSHLYQSDLPELDLLIRTSKVQRLSDFFLWQTARAELVFLDILWPDITQKLVADLLETHKENNQ
jgi:undecaprenyl diphosphate synthase